jgi:hypothetical protein
MDFEASSFRDPSGVVFYDKNNDVFRGIREKYKSNYEFFINSGLYDELVNKGLIVSHNEVKNSTNIQFYKVIKPEKVPFISYPYEWSFSQLKTAALTTLEIQRISLNYGMILKDSSVYNIQFFGRKAKLIDTLSFEVYKEGIPWVAYKQFCQHFLAPLALMSLNDVRLSRLLRLYVDGIPLDLTIKLLSKKYIFHSSVFTHIFLHSLSQTKYSNKKINKKYLHKNFSKLSMLGIIDNLVTAISKLRLKSGNTEWGNYYNITNYSSKSFNNKKRIVLEYVKFVNPKNVWDFGSNNGEFSRIASNLGSYVVSIDIDPVAVENNYLYSVGKDENNLLPIVLDLTNPSPSIGWANNERLSITDRGPTDLIFSLALIHHLAISNNLPFQKIAEYFGSLCSYLIIEFIPKTDSKVKILLSTREDIFENYDINSFESVFKNYFKIVKKDEISGSKRVMYLMKSRFNKQ